MHTMAVVLKRVTALALATLALSCGKPHVGVQQVPNDPATAGTTFVPTPPGLPNDPVPIPTHLGKTECTTENSANIEVYAGVPGTMARPTLDRAEGASANQFVVHWTVCNAGKFAQEAGSSYVVTTTQLTIDTTQAPGSPGRITRTPLVGADKSPTLPIPALASCDCFVQEVGVNMTVPAAALQQPQIQGLQSSFPEIVLTAPTPQPNKLFQFEISLPDSFGTDALPFTIQ